MLALDWLGMMNSSRPRFPRGCTPHCCGRECCASADKSVDLAIDFMVSSLEAWREAMGVDKMQLLCHSVGAYYGTHYAMKHPDKVEKLVLISPAGLGESPTYHCF